MGSEKGKAVKVEYKCELCKYYRDGVCNVLLWANGRRVQMGSVPGNGKCDLWEPKDD